MSGMEGRKLLPFPGVGPQNPTPQSLVLVGEAQWVPVVLVLAPVQESFASYQILSLTWVRNLKYVTVKTVSIGKCSA